MRILFVIPYFYPAEAFGGPVRVAFDVGKDLVKRGHEVVVFTSDARDLEHRLGVEYDEIAGMSVHYFRNLSMFPVKWSKLFITPDLHWTLKSELKSFDVVHCHEYTTYQNIVVHHLAKHKIPYIVQAHGSLPRIDRNTRKWLYDIFFGSNLLRDASNVIALSQVEAEQYKHVGVPSEKIDIVPNGIDLAEYANLPPKGSFRKKFGINDDENLILFLGRIHKIKGVDILVRAFAKVVEKLDDAKLVVAGPDDGYLRELKTLIRTLKIADNVLISGPLHDKDKVEAYVDADVYVLPSRYETFPMTVLEAVACGTPVLLTENCGVTDYFNCRVGNVVKPNPSTLSEGLLDMLFDGEQRALFRHNCEAVIERFGISRVVSQLEEVYKKIACA